MLSILVVCHGNLAYEFVDAAQRILGEEDPLVVPLSIGWNQEASEAKEAIRKNLKKLLEKTSTVLVLTDLFGGTPTNLAMTFYQAEKVEILTGVNLPMLIKAILLRREGLPSKEALPLLREKGQSAMVSVSEVLTPEEGAGA